MGIRDVTAELKGRRGIFEVLAEETGSQPLVGQILLEALDLIVEPTTQRLIPNPRSPEMPIVEIFTSSNLSASHTRQPLAKFNA